MSEFNNMSPLQVKRMKEINNDPIKWAQVFLRTFNTTSKKIEPWTARWYQVEMMRDRSVKKVYRCGRRIGKCLPGHVRVFDPKTGDRVRVDELYKRKKANLLTMTDNYKLRKHYTDEILDNGIKEVFKVTTRSGRSIDATSNHPLFTAKGWKEIEELEVGQKVAIASNLKYFGQSTMNENEIKLLAYMIGDGNCSSKAIRFCNSKKMIVDELKRAVNYFDCELVQYDSCRDIDYNIVKLDNKRNNNVPNKVKLILEKHNLFGKTAHYKRIPDEIFRLTKNDTALFLSRLYATDGWVWAKNNQHHVGYSSASRELIADVQHLLLKFNIDSSVRTKKKKYRDGTVKIHYHLVIANSNHVIKFHKEIGIFSREEEFQAAFKMARENNRNDLRLPKEILEFVEEDRVRQGFKKNQLAKGFALELDHDVQRRRLKEFGKTLKNDDIINFADGEFFFDEIVSIESIGKMQTYDLSVPVTMNFVAEDFITHNTETMVVEMLWQAFTRKNFRIVMAAPYENQIRNMFTRLNELIKESPLLKSEIVRSTKNPYCIELKNGSKILGFTAGDDAASIRGQRADFLDYSVRYKLG